MAKSKFEYVKSFEENDSCLLNCWIVVRIDGKGFHKFSEAHKFAKPNDLRSLSLMNHCALKVMERYPDIVISIGESDEYSFVFRKGTSVYKRRASKLSSLVVSLFSSFFVLLWAEHFGPDCPLLLEHAPSFDSRVILYPSDKNLRDYLSWRQADCHINNMYNTCYWCLVNNKGLNRQEAEDTLKGTDSAQKQELLFSDFGINYNNIPAIYRKGTVIIRQKRAKKPRSFKSKRPVPGDKDESHVAVSTVSDDTHPKTKDTSPAAHESRPQTRPDEGKVSDVNQKTAELQQPSQDCKTAHSQLLPSLHNDAPLADQSSTMLQSAGPSVPVNQHSSPEKLGTTAPVLAVLHVDIIGNTFWSEHPEILSS